MDPFEIDATAELQHLLRELRHDLWGNYVSALGRACDVVSVADDRDMRARAVHAAAAASALWAKAEMSATVKVPMMRVVMLEVNWVTMEMRRTLVAARHAHEITELAGSAGLIQPEGTRWRLQRERGGP